MAISFLTNCISPNLFFLENPYKTQAIELFGKGTAKYLRSKNGNWKKVIKSWNVFYETYIAIKDSCECFYNVPKELNGSLQFNDQLVFKMNRRTRHNISDTEGILITPFGYFIIECKTEKAMKEFINRLEEKFYKKRSQGQYRNTEYSFTLVSNKKASIRSLDTTYESKRIKAVYKYVFKKSH